MGAAPCLSCLQPTDLSITLSLDIRMWVLFILFANPDLSHTISIHQLVSATPCQSYLLTPPALSLASLWVPPLICHVWHLPTSLSLCLCLSGCEYNHLFIIHCLLTSLLLCLCLPVCECHLLFILFTICWPLLLCLYLPGCECCPLFILLVVCWPLHFSVSAC